MNKSETLTMPSMSEGADQKKKRLSQRALTLLACFGLPFFAMILIYCCLQVWPVGEHSVLVLDLNAQYVYYFEQLRDVLTGGETLLYSFERALGGEFMGIFAYYLSSPFSLLVALFPKEMITEALYLILVLKTGFCGLSFGYYLTKTRDLRPLYTVSFAVMYALCSYVVVMQHNVMWIDNVIAFPLLLLGVDSLIKQGKFKLYVLALVYAVFSNFYIGYMTCLFVFFYFFARYFMLTPQERNPGRERAHFAATLMRIALWTLVALMICAVILLPTYYSLTFGKLSFSNPNYTPKQMFEFADIVTKAFFGSYDTVRPAGMPFIYGGTLALILAPLYFFAEGIPTRRKVGMAFMMALLLVSFNFSIFDIVWHGMQRPNWLNARFAFMFTGLMLIMAADALKELPRLGKKAATLSAVLWCALLVILSKIGYDNLPDFTAVWASIFFFIVLAAVLPSCIRSMKDPDVCRAAAGILCAVVTVEAIANGVVMLYRLDEDVSFSNRYSYRQMIDDYSEATAVFMDEEDNEFYRAEKLVHRKKNDNFALDLRGLSNSTSTLNARAIDLLSQFGYASMSHWSMFAGATAVTDALFDIKYLIVDESDSKDVMDYIHDLYIPMTTDEDQLDVYENSYALSIAYSVDEEILGYDPVQEEVEGVDNYVDPFTYMNRLLSAMTGETVEVWRRVTVDSFKDQGVKNLNVVGHKGYEKNNTATAKLTWTLDVESTDRIYVYFPSKYPRESTLYLNGEKLGKYFKSETFSIRELGSFDVGEEVKVALCQDEEKMYIRKGCAYFWYFDEAMFELVMEELQEGVMGARSDRDDCIYGHITVPKGDSVVFTTIPYDAGWKVTVDGEEVQTIAVLRDTLLAFEAKPGEHEIVMTYRPDCVKYGTLLTAAGLLIFIGAVAVDGIRKRRLRAADGIAPLAEEAAKILPDEEIFEDAKEPDAKDEDPQNNVTE